MNLDNDEFFEAPLSRADLIQLTHKSTCWIGTPGCPGITTGSPMTNRYCGCQRKAIKAKEVLETPAHLLDDYELELAIKQLKPKPESNETIGVYDLL